MLLRQDKIAFKRLLDAPAKKVVLSGPSGFLGNRVLKSILSVHELRKNHGLDPGEIILMSSSPGRLMEKLYRKYGAERMNTVKATRVDYYNQHDIDVWIDHLGSLGKFYSTYVTTYSDNNTIA